MSTRSRGLHAIGMKISADQLARIACLTICQLWDNHFVLVEPSGDGALKVTNPPDEPRTVSTGNLGKSYSGFALLVAQDPSLLPTPKAEGPDLRFDEYVWDFGVVNEGDHVEHVFKSRNAGNGELVVSKVETSCRDCLVPLGGPQTIPAGGEGTIKVLLTTANQWRGVAKKLYVSSNDPISPVVHLAVTGYVRPALFPFSPRSVSFGQVRRAETGETEIYLPLVEEDKIEVTSVSSDSPYVTAELAPSKQKDRPGYIITAALRPGAPIGELKAAITIVSNHWKQPKVEVPVTAVIRGNIDLDRESFFLGIVKKGAEKKCVVTLSTVAKDHLKIEKVESSLSCVSVEVAPKTEGKEYVLTATLKPDPSTELRMPLGNIKGEVTIRTNDLDQPEIKVRVYAYVSDL